MAACESSREHTTHSLNCERRGEFLVQIHKMPRIAQEDDDANPPSLPRPNTLRVRIESNRSKLRFLPYLGWLLLGLVLLHLVLELDKVHSGLTAVVIVAHQLAHIADLGVAEPQGQLALEVYCLLQSTDQALCVKPGGGGGGSRGGWVA